jgi:RNA polymerase sigma factor (sigma-70 family)
MRVNLPKEYEQQGERSDAELVLASRRGDKRAFVEIVSRHQAMVCGIALGIVGDFAASEDAGQEAFITAWRKLHELREPERLRPWLGQIARNAALGQLRRRRGHETLDATLPLADESPTPDQAAATEDEAELVRACLAKLPETNRVPLILYYREGESVSKVAETLGISEEAVRQRLVRGREMLRDRMSAVIGTVLTRTRPNHIFTMTVAIAVGALAAPSIMAGGVFAATATATGSTAATTSSTSFFAAMSTSKTLLITTAIVALACIPIGYQMRTQVNRSIKPRRAIIGNPESVSGRTEAPGAADSAVIAQWKELHQRYGTNAQSMPELYRAIGDITNNFRRQAFRAALISEWVQVDPTGGLPFLLASKGPVVEHRRQFFKEWLEKDPQAAVAGLMTAGKGWENVARDCLTNIAGVLPGNIPDLVSRLPKGESYWDTSVRDAFGRLATENLESARKAAEEITGVNRLDALSGIALAWGKQDLNEAIRWAKGLPEGTDRDELIRAALVGKATVDPAAALASVGTVPAGGKYAYFGTSTGARVLAEAGKTDFDATVAWLAANPASMDRHDLEGLSYLVQERLNGDAQGFLTSHAADGSLSVLLPAINSALMNGASGQQETVWEWLKTQPANDASLALKEHVINEAAWEDPKLALHIAADLPAGPEGDRMLQTMARSLFNSGSMLGRFDSLLPEAPERLRQPLIEAAFSLIQPGYLNDPQVWISRLSLLPEGPRTAAIESLAKAWGGQTPEAAAAWASALPPGDTHNAAEAGIASAWAKNDAQGAADWVSTLPVGAERDRGAEALVLAVANLYPREAWDWALSIGDSAGRERAASQAVTMMAKRDATTARQWIDSGPFTEPTKIKLLAAIQKPTL